MFVFSAIYSIYQVITCHDGFDTCLLYGSFKRWKVNFLQRAFGYFRTDCIAVKLLIVGCEVFYGGDYSSVLYRFNKRDYHFGCQIGIFAEILEITGSFGSPVVVYSRS